MLRGNQSVSQYDERLLSNGGGGALVMESEGSPVCVCVFMCIMCFTNKVRTSSLVLFKGLGGSQVLVKGGG